MNVSRKIYHIVHMDNLASIIADGYLFSDAEMRKRARANTVVGMKKIKERRLSLPLSSYPGLHVGECVPFYFCPRSPMLYMLHMSNSSDLEYRGGQELIVHLVADLHDTVDWARANNIRWVFTNSNAGSYYFEDYSDLAALDKIDWEAVEATQWSGRQDKKQAEFLVERSFPWELVEEIGVYSRYRQKMVYDVIGLQENGLQVRIRQTWYY